MDQLTITEIDLGDRIPSIGHASAPYLDDRGLWIELDISYEGGFSITLETKCNLIKVTQTKSEAMSDSPLHDKRLDIEQIGVIKIIKKQYYYWIKKMIAEMIYKIIKEQWIETSK